MAAHSSTPRIAVVGGGIGGLSAAYILRSRGLDVEVFEQAPALGEVGAGVQLTPNSLRLMQRAGLGDAVAEAGARFESGSSYYRLDGTFVSPSVITDSSGWKGLYGMHRADLLDIFASRLPDAVVHTGHKCIGFEQDQHGARVEFANGRTIEADIVVAADGLHSTLRPYVTADSVPVFSGMIAYRGLLPTSLLPDWPHDAWELWMGSGSHFLVFPVRSGELINYVGFVRSTSETEESWSALGDPDRLRSEFAGWDPRIEELLSHVHSTHWWGLYDREPLARWTEGRLTLLGDAAHPMLPHLGQGANQAIEDAFALATILSEGDDADYTASLSSYETLRRERTKAVQAGSRRNSERYDSHYEDLDERDREMAEHEKVRWPIYDYDAEDAARQILPGGGVRDHEPGRAVPPVASN